MCFAFRNEIFRFEIQLCHGQLSGLESVKLLNLLDPQYNGDYNSSTWISVTIKIGAFIYIAVALYFENEQHCIHIWSFNGIYM